MRLDRAVVTDGAETPLLADVEPRVRHLPLRVLLLGAGVLVCWTLLVLGSRAHALGVSVPAAPGPPVTLPAPALPPPDAVTGVVDHTTAPVTNTIDHTTAPPSDALPPVTRPVTTTLARVARPVTGVLQPVTAPVRDLVVAAVPPPVSALGALPRAAQPPTPPTPTPSIESITHVSRPSVIRAHPTAATEFIASPPARATTSPTAAARRFGRSLRVVRSTTSARGAFDHAHPFAPSSPRPASPAAPPPAPVDVDAAGASTGSGSAPHADAGAACFFGRSSIGPLPGRRHRLLGEPLPLAGIVPLVDHPG